MIDWLEAESEDRLTAGLFFSAKKLNFLVKAFNLLVDGIGFDRYHCFRDC